MRSRGVGDRAKTAARALLAAVAVALVVWSFVRVGSRELRRFLETRGGIELVVLHWSGEGGPEEDEIVESSLRAFEAANPGIRVRRINPGDSAGFYTKLQTMLAAGEPPDLFYVGSERVASFSSLGILEPLDDFVARDPGTLVLDDFWPATVNAFRFDGSLVGSGTLYGIPKDFTTVGFYLNKDLFRKAGLELPSYDWTWDEYIAIARRLAQLDDTIGSEFVTWPFIVRAYLRTEGVDVRGASFDDVTLRDPVVLEALARLRSWRHDEERTLTSGKSKLATGAAAFATGRVGMAGPFGRWVVPEYRRITEFDWDFRPLPRGRERSNIIATVSWSMSSESRHKAEAWKLLRWLVSPESQAAQARLGLAIPSLATVSETEAFLDPTQLPHSDDAYLAPLRSGETDVRVVDWPADPTFEQILGSRLNQALLTGDLPLDAAVADFEAAWSAHRNSPLQAKDFPKFPWRTVTIAAVAVAALGAIALVVTYRRSRGPASTRREERAGLLMVSPWVTGFAIFMAVPMVLSFLLSLSNWQGITRLGEAQAVGLGNYTQLFLHDARFRTSLWVTFYYVLVAVPLGQVTALLAATLMNAKVRGIELYRAVWYLPSVLAGVGVAVLWRWMFDPEAGLINAALTPLLGLVGAKPPEWFGADAAAWGPPAFAIMSLWSVGGSMMIYLAGLQNVPKELLEAADMDRVGPVGRFFRVTLPMLSPVVLFNSLMALIGSFQVFTQAYVMTAGEPGDLTRFYVLYLYNQAFDLYAMGYASAMAWILLVIVLVITVILLRTSRGLVHYEGLRS
ncbi:MAG: extracellular solute-binding protein [Phycisphaerae bacterium]|nr:extracellular solute-binding protein [Phycisphaerae bacterium]